MKSATISFVLLFCISSTAFCDTFGTHPDDQFTIEFVEVGNPGNLPDVTGFPNPAGSVDYVYRMGKHEISREMIEKANNIGELEITLDEMLMVDGGPSPQMPASGLSWNQAARFVNWLNTSAGHSPAYKFETQPGDADYDAFSNIQLWESGDPGFDSDNQYRNSNAHYFLPSADEWYKAAYYDPEANGGEGGYWDFPNGSDTPPIPVASGTEDNTAVFAQPTEDGPAPVTEAGGLSPYRVMGLAGNVYEWQESQWDGLNDHEGKYRQVRGGTWDQFPDPEHPLDIDAIAGDYFVTPNVEVHWIGFRVAAASVPEPSTIHLLISGLVLWIAGRSRAAR